MIVVITGKLSRPRNELIDEFAKYNISVLDSMKRGVDYLITNTPNSGSRKNIIAQNLDVERISESNFREYALKRKETRKTSIVEKRTWNTPPKTTTKPKQTTETTLTRYLDF